MLLGVSFLRILRAVGFYRSQRDVTRRAETLESDTEVQTLELVNDMLVLWHWAKLLKFS